MTSTALLIMDVQQGIVDRFGGAEAEGYLAGLGSAIAAARQAGIEVAGVADWTASLR